LYKKRGRVVICECGRAFDLSGRGYSYEHVALDSRLRGNDVAGGGNDMAGGGNDVAGGGNDVAGGGNDVAGGANMT